MHSTGQVLFIQPSPATEKLPAKPKTTGRKGWEADVLKNGELSGLAFWDLHLQACNHLGVLLTADLTGNQEK